MTTLAQQGTQPTGFPTRFREGEARSRRLGRPLRLLGRIDEVDEDLMERIGRAFGERDEAGARLAEAIRMRAGTPGKVTMTQLRTALEHGVAAVESPPATAPRSASTRRRSAPASWAWCCSTAATAAASASFDAMTTLFAPGLFTTADLRCSDPPDGGPAVILLH